MKKYLKGLSVVLVTLIAMFCLSTTAFASDTEQDGLKIELKTDKENYSLNEDIEITITVTNTNDFTVYDVSIEALLPDGFSLKESSQSTVSETIDLQSGEQTTFTVTAVVDNEDETTDTSDTETTTALTTTTTQDNTTATVKTTASNTTSSASSNEEGSTSATEAVAVAATTTTTTTTSAKSTSSDSSNPYTGTQTAVMGTFIVLFLASMATLLYCMIKRLKKTTKVVSSLLCAVIAINSIVGLSAFKAFANDTPVSSDVSISETTNESEYDYIISITANLSLIVGNNHYTISAKVSYYNYKLTVFELNNTINEINDKFVISDNDDETVENAIEVFNEIVKYLDDMKKQGKIRDYTQSGTSIKVDLLFGVYIYDFSRNVPELQSVSSSSSSKVSEYNTTVNTHNNFNSSDLSVITVEPYANEFVSTVFDDSADLIENSDLGYNFSNNLDNEAVTVEFMKNLSEYKVIIFSGHGVSDNGSFCGVATGEVATKENYYEHLDDINNKLIGFCGDSELHYYVTPEFFDEYYDENSFNNSLIYLGCCNAGNDDSTLPDILISKGVKAVLTFKNSVYFKYNQNMCETIFNELVKQDNNTGLTKSVAEALKFAKIKNGDKDPTHTNWFNKFKSVYGLGEYKDEESRAELILFENDNNSFKLKDYDTGSISGRVKESETLNPISNMEVRIYNENYTSGNEMYTLVTTTTTDENGGFSVSLPAGNYILQVGGESSVNDDYGYSQTEISFTVESGVTSVLSNDILLNRIENGITGYVYEDDYKTPIADVTVEVYKLNDNETTNYIGTCTTDENGKFLLGVDTNGSYTLICTKLGYEDVTTLPTFVNGGIASAGNIYMTAEKNISEDKIYLSNTNSFGDSIAFIINENKLLFQGYTNIPNSKKAGIYIEDLNGISDIDTGTGEYIGSFDISTLSEGKHKIKLFISLDGKNLTTVPFPSAYITVLNGNAYFEKDNIYQNNLTKFEELNNKNPDDYLSMSELRMNTQEVSAIKQKAKEITKNASNDYEKAFLIYQWICKNISYDNDSLTNLDNLDIDTQKPYAVLTNEKAICQGYSELTQAMLRSIGIPCIFVRGTGGSDIWDTPTSIRISHSWNYAYVNDGNGYRWVSLDTTFGAGYKIDNGNKILGTSYSDDYVYTTFFFDQSELAVSHTKYIEDFGFLYV